MIKALVAKYYHEFKEKKSDQKKENGDNNFQSGTQKNSEIISREIISDKKQVNSIYDSNMN